MLTSQIQKNLKLAIQNAIKKASESNVPRDLAVQPQVELEIPKDKRHGDLTTNIAMRLAKNFSLNSVALANLLKDSLTRNTKQHQLDVAIEKIEVSAPGFINFWFTKDCLDGILSDISACKKAFGKSDQGRGKKVNIEFVSANPTGPLTVAHGRQAAVGDALGRILGFSGYKVTREYFINDVGTQIEILGESIHARYLEENGLRSDFPADGYRGEYIKDIARDLKTEHGRKLIEKSQKNLDLIAQYGVSYMLRVIEKDLEKFGISFDKWFSQKKLSSKIVRGVLNNLKGKGYIYEKDGATWFKSTAFGDDKDRVVIKKDNAFTYLAPDIAYHLNKFKRGFRKLIDIWGPDHHGYISRLKASIEALGYDKGALSVLIVQLATLSRDGVSLSMSTRKGEFITLREVIDEVGCDVAKFFFLMIKLGQHLDFDLEVAKRDSQDNPVYYIQYAHARIASIFRFGKAKEKELAGVKYDPAFLGRPEEILLLRMLLQFPLAVESSAKSLEPYRIIAYLNELAKIFHNFYSKHRVVTDDLPLTKARLALVSGVKTVLANGLSLLGVSLPERM